MDNWQPSRKKKRRSRTSIPKLQAESPHVCIQIVDACLLGLLFVAPLFFGGRHDAGRFVFVLLSGIAAVAWLVHQTISKQSHWTLSWAHVLGLAALALVALQLIPLPMPWLESLAPRNLSLLTLWKANQENPVALGEWNTLTLTPASTRTALAMLIAYVLLFLTTLGRMRNKDDVEQLVRRIGFAAIVMSGFGIVQYLSANGRFFWLYQHPYATTSHSVIGSFSSPNHFAHFLALGLGPLFAWCLLAQQTGHASSSSKHRTTRNSDKLIAITLHASVALVAAAVLMSLSRGGAIALTAVCVTAAVIYFRQGLLSGAYLYGFATLGLVVVGMLSMADYERVADRLDDFAAGSIHELDSNEGRRRIWSANAQAIQSGSMFGAGAGSHAEIYPVYLSQSHNRKYTHAENGYLQIATENGYLGIGLLALAILMVVGWCWRAVRSASTRREMILAGGITASLFASVVHSVVDFVWFIPACMSLTVMLAACILRLAKLESSRQAVTPQQNTWSNARWVSLTAGVASAAIWSIATLVGPAMASSSLDKYLLAAKANKQSTYESLLGKQQTDNEANNEIDERPLRIDAMVFHLRNVLKHSPNSPHANICLARNVLRKFSLLQNATDNPMSIDQIRDAAIASQFASSEELRDWLLRACGEHSRLLYQAHYHTRQALKRNPMLGEGYLILANLCFLEGKTAKAVDAYVQQSLRVRPFDGDILFEAGRQKLLGGHYGQAFPLWQQAYRDDGTHQFLIVQQLGGQIPAQAFIELFEPRWSTIRNIWQRYRQLGSLDDLQIIRSYAESAAQKEQDDLATDQAAYVWHYLSKMQSDLGDEQASLASVRQAYRLAPSTLWVRRTLGQKLLQAEQYDEAETHLRWCLARQPSNKNLQQELIHATTTRQRYSAAEPKSPKL